MKNFFKIFCLLAAFSVFAVSCDDSDDDSMSELDLSINYFIWENMNLYYLWTDNVSALDEKNYSSKEDVENNLLKKYPDHEEFFNSLLYKKGEVDRFSWIVDDYEKLEKMFQGITKSMGFDFVLGKIGTTDNVFGLVRYVVKGGPADRAGLKRGDFFTRIDDQQLTVSNYNTLLSNENSYKIGLAEVIDHKITNLSTSYNLTAEEVHENPIYLDTIYTIKDKKIGYLVYNGFMSNYDNQLNAVFAKFKQAGIQDLILDLRYNGGGSLASAKYLASMIYSTDTTLIFNKNSYNADLEKYIIEKEGKNALNEYFAAKIKASDDTREEAINSLGLKSLYVITTSSTASASEILINDLKPFIKVTMIGGTTYGKYVGSITIKDYDRNDKLNPNHKWALQPIIMKSTNKNGVSDFYNGLTPDEKLEEDITNLLPFGNTEELLLKAAIAKINGTSSAKKAQAPVFSTFAERKDLIPHSREMHLNDVFKMK
ncbi:MAG TPA: S41 family peptidase [Bacteroidales bacterium]